MHVRLVVVATLLALFDEPTEVIQFCTLYHFDAAGIEALSDVLTEAKVFAGGVEQVVNLLVVELNIGGEYTDVAVSLCTLLEGQDISGGPQ